MMDVAFVLVPDYALMSLTAAVEPLRAANQLADRTLYRCTYHSAAGGFAASTSGGGFETAPLTDLISRSDVLPDLVFVVAGGNPLLHEDRDTARVLRLLDARRRPLGGISGGAAILAKEGLMAGRRFTLHWAHVDALLDYAPELLVERALYVIDRDRYSCAGGVAALDMMCGLIARQHGATFARSVSDWFIHPRLRTAEEPQRSRLAERFDLRHPALEAAVELMTGHIADPLTPGQIADLSDTSARHLQRLFAARFGMPMMQFYRDLRLAKADELLNQSALPLVDVALLTGFATLAHFTRCFTARYGAPPGRRRRLQAGR